MESTICTLFENDYHFGVAALTNSLYECGFRGKVYAGYHGKLPAWAGNAKVQKIGKWEKATVLDVTNDLELIFIPLSTNFHLSNYKPDFMLDLLEGPAKNSDAIFYFDPDICVVEKWSFFEEWISCGVALCEDVNSPLPENHPRRVGWRKYFSKYQFDLKFRAPEYFNSGFIGVTHEHISFIKLWQVFQIAMADDINGLHMSIFKNSLMDSKKLRNFYMFNRPDQDALNACSEVYENFLSVMGKEAMAFKFGARMMSHALGQPKPWQNNYFICVLKAIKPGLAHKDYWRYCNSLIISQARFKQQMTNIFIQLASITSRLYGG